MEGLTGVDGEDDENSLAVAVIILCDGFVFVLTSSVPNLQFNSNSVQFDDLEDIIDADGHHVVFDELSLAVAQQDVALSDSGVSDDDYFLEVVEVLLAFAFNFA